MKRTYGDGIRFSKHVLSALGDGVIAEIVVIISDGSHVCVVQEVRFQCSDLRSRRTIGTHILSTS